MTVSGLRRGEIWEFDLGERRGREQAGTRPCLVVSTDSMNKSAFATVIVCPITTRHRPTFAWRPGLEPDDLQVVADDWQPLPSWIQTDQVRTLDIDDRATRRLATVVSDTKLTAVDASLRMMLSL